MSEHPSRQHSYSSSHDLSMAQTPQRGSRHQQQASGSQYGMHAPNAAVPGAFPPGRPLVPSTPGSALPTIQTPTQQQSRQASTSHSYSHSSPAGIDQNRYVPLSLQTINGPKYSTPQNHRYTASQASQNDSIYSPLGLADIRSTADSTALDHPMLGTESYSNVAFKSSYQAPWPIYALDWCKWPAQGQSDEIPMGKMAIGSYVEDGHNSIQVLETHAKEESDMNDMSDPNGYSVGYRKTAEATQSYPVTRILWEPQSATKQSTDLLATSGDHLRLWSLPQDQQSQAQNNSSSITSRQQSSSVTKLIPLALLSNSKSPEHTAPLTSLDWNTVSPSLIITSSIDTTCTIWDIPTLTAKTQLIAHDREVFDVRFCATSVDVFVSCGADGSVRMFDLRSLEHSTIIYEPSEKANEPNSHSPMSPSTKNASHSAISHSSPLLRLAASPHDAHLLATFSQESNIIRILDVRQPGQAMLELQGHAGAINCLDWSPSRRGTLASGADDSLVLIWDLLSQSSTIPHQATSRANAQSSSTGSAPTATHGPMGSWQCGYEVNNLSWAPQNGLSSGGSDWLGVSGGRNVWGVAM